MFYIIGGELADIEPFALFFKRDHDVLMAVEIGVEVRATSITVTKLCISESQNFTIRAFSFFTETILKLIGYKQGEI